jgi:hypothetical protein
MLFVFSVLYYKERFVFLDGAHFLFHILRTNSFAIFHNRFIAILTEIYPVIASKLSLSLPVITQLYSAGFIIDFFACYFICGTLLKRYDFALVILFINMLFVSDTFYWLISEISIGLVLLALFFAIMYGKKNLNLKVLFVNIIAAPLLAFSHPLLIFPFTFGIVFFILQKENLHYLCN